MQKKPKVTKAQKQLEKSSVQREEQLRVERAREASKTFTDQMAFRKRMRGIFSLMSNGFQGFGSSKNLGSS